MIFPRAIKTLLALFLIFTFMPIDGALSDPQSFENVRNCPEDVDQRHTSRVVMQHIDGLFYKWEEVDLDSNGTFCIIMRKPEQRRLSTGEAKVLLQDSAGWLEAQPPTDIVKTMDPMNPYLQGVPVETPKSCDLTIKNGKRSTDHDQPAPRCYPEKALEPNENRELLALESDRSAVGQFDDRERVTNSTSYPWNTVGFVGLSYSGARMRRGSGTIVTPHMVLTAGHAIFDRENGEYASTLRFCPGQTQLSEDEAVTQPYGSFEAESWQTNSAYTNPDTDRADSPMYDYAAAFFDRSFADVGITTYMPVVFELNQEIGGTINHAGYPPEVKEETQSRAMWFSIGDVTAAGERRIHHNADTSGGNSGGPIWQKSGATGKRGLVAIHVASVPDSTVGIGCRLVPQNQAIIEEWMSWTPPGKKEPGTNDGGGDSGGGGCFIAVMPELPHTPDH